MNAVVVGGGSWGTAFAKLLRACGGIAGLEPITGQVHFFQNVSGFTSIPLRFSVADSLAVLTLVAWLLRRLVRANASARMGPLGWPMLALAGFFGVGMMVGIARGDSET